MKDIKKMAVELYDEAKSQGLIIRSVSFDDPCVLVFGKQAEVAVEIDARLCSKKEKAPE